MAPLAATLVALALAQTSPDTQPPPIPPPVVPVPAILEAPPPPIPSLLSATPLRGTSLLSASAGWPGFRAAYAQGVGSRTDLGLFTEFDVSTTELRAGVTYRGQVIPRAPPFDGALRLSLAWYHDLGSRWLYHQNRVDRGLEIGVGVSYSHQGPGGLLSLLADLPITIGTRESGGVLFRPRVSGAFEAPFYGPFTVGLQLGLGARIGAGSTALRRGMGEVIVLGLASCRLL